MSAQRAFLTVDGGMAGLVTACRLLARFPLASEARDIRIVPFRADLIARLWHSAALLLQLYWPVANLKHRVEMS